MTQKSCAVGMRNAKLGNHLNEAGLSSVIKPEYTNTDALAYKDRLVIKQLQAVPSFVSDISENIKIDFCLS